jgi:uncharacterized protein YceK
MTIFTRLFVVSALFVMSGCGTILHSTSQKFGVSSNPAGAIVTLNGKEMGQTPMSLSLSRKQSHMVSVSLAGYENFQILVEKKLSKWALGDLVLGGPIGLIVDHATGGIYRLTPEQLDTQFKGGQLASKKQHGVLYLSVVMEADPNWEQIGTLSTMRRKPSAEQ